MTITIPSAPAELEAMLNDDKWLTNVLSEGKLADVVKQYAENVGKKDVDLKAQIDEQVQAGLAEFLKANPTNAKRLNLHPANGETPVRGTGAVRNAAYNPLAPTAELDGFYNGLGEMALEVHKHKSGRPVSNAAAFEKVQKITNAYSETDPATGGFLVPEEMRSTLLQLALEQSIVRSRATVITMGSLTTKIPYVDATTHVGSVFGGMQFYWVGESASITPTEAKFGNVKLEANKLVGGARIPNELWADAAALSTWLDTAAPMGIAFYEDSAFLSGTGVGQPLGVLKSEALIQATRATNDQLTPSDIYTMYARMLPQSLGNAVWLVNQTLLPKLFGMQTIVKNVAGTENVGGGFPLGVVNMAGSPLPTILGRPMIVTEKLPALANGAGNDIAFVDLSYYLVGDRQAISLDYSEHSRFMNDETELRIIERVDGRPWVQSPLTPKNGDTVSPFIGLAD
jgi:HK97 family phage major capsid protein